MPVRTLTRLMRRSGTFDDSQLWRADPVLHARVSERCRLSPVHLVRHCSGVGHLGRQCRAGRNARSASALASRLQLPRVCRGGSRRLSAGTTLVPDDGYRLLLGEPGPAENA